jgi:hypothetical protein
MAAENRTNSPHNFSPIRTLIRALSLHTVGVFLTDDNGLAVSSDNLAFLAALLYEAFAMHASSVYQPSYATSLYVIDPY